MKRSIHLTGLMFVLSLLSVSGCSEDGDLNVFSLEEDIQLGEQVKQETRSNPDMVVLDRSQYADAYAFLENMRDDILNDDDIQHKDDFTWTIDIVQDDNTLNAFAAPGGYIVVFTGLIKFLDTSSDLAGVMGHEVAHADRRHVTDQLTKQFGLQTLLGVLAGNDPGTLTQIAAGLTTLSFTRNNESEADEFSVKYLCSTPFAANGAAAFFQKLLDEEMTSGTPQFLSTHPSPDNRVDAINSQSTELSCDNSGPPNQDAAYQDFKNSLP